MLVKLKDGIKNLRSASPMIFRVAGYILLASLLINFILGILVWKSGSNKAYLKVCTTMNESNKELCDGVASELSQCTQMLGRELNSMALAVEKFSLKSQIAQQKQLQTEEYIYEALENFNENGDCLYPDDIANLMFKNKLEVTPSEHPDSEDGKD